MCHTCHDDDDDWSGVESHGEKIIIMNGGGDEKKFPNTKISVLDPFDQMTNPHTPVITPTESATVGEEAGKKNIILSKYLVKHPYKSHIRWVEPNSR